MKKYDAVIIGFGKGGKTLAQDFGKRGFKVVVVEKSDKMYGGTCINVGCIPTKFLIQKGLTFKKSESFEENKARYSEFIQGKTNLVNVLRKKNYDMLDTIEGVDIYDGLGSFVDKKTIRITGKESSFEIEGEKIFINTGATTVIPPIEGLKDNSFVYDSKSIMELETLPKELVVIGGGYIGLEFAQMYSDFGSKVTVLEGSKIFMPREEPEIASKVKSMMAAEGIEIKLGARVKKLEKNRVFFEIDGVESSVVGDAILVAIGRKPNIEGLNLENAGVKLTDRGAVEVDEKLHTSVENIWAIGDVHGGLQFTYTSLDDYRIIRDELFGKGEYNLTKRKVVPYTVFIKPQFSRVGMTEREAIEAGYEVKVAVMAPATPKMKIIDGTEGLLKVVVDAKTNKILGASFLMKESSEVINSVALTMKADMDYTFLRDNIFTHPTVSEILNDVFGMVK